MLYFSYPGQDRNACNAYGGDGSPDHQSIYIQPSFILPCQLLNLVHNHVDSMKQGLTLPRTQNLNLSQHRSQDEILVMTMFRSRSFSVVFVTLTYIKFVMSGVQCLPFIHAFLDMRLLAESQRLATQSQSSNPVT